METKKTNQVKETKTGVLDSIFDKVAKTYDMPANQITSVLRDTAFKVDGDPVSNSEMVALLSVADKYGLNPFTREIYAFRNKKTNAIMPIVPIDGWVRKMNDNENHDGIELRFSENMVKIGKMKCSAHEWVETIITRKDRANPIIMREYLDECYNGSFYDGSPWNSHPKRMLRHKSIIQCIRIAYGISGIYDHDEAVRAEEATPLPVNEIEEPIQAKNTSFEQEVVPPAIKRKTVKEKIESFKEPVENVPTNQVPEPIQEPEPETVIDEVVDTDEIDIFSETGEVDSEIDDTDLF